MPNNRWQPTQANQLKHTKATAKATAKEPLANQTNAKQHFNCPECGATMLAWANLKRHWSSPMFTWPTRFRVHSGVKSRWKISGESQNLSRICAMAPEEGKRTLAEEHRTLHESQKLFGSKAGTVGCGVFAVFFWQFFWPSPPRQKAHFHRGNGENGDSAFSFGQRRETVAGNGTSMPLSITPERVEKMKQPLSADGSAGEVEVPRVAPLAVSPVMGTGDGWDAG